MTASSLDNRHFTEAHLETTDVRSVEARGIVNKSRMAVALLGLGLSIPSAWSIGAISDMNEANTMAAAAIERGAIKPGELDEINSKVIPGLTDFSAAKRRYLETLPKEGANAPKVTRWEAEWNAMK